MADFSFDIVSKADRMEVDNAVNQAIRELANRFDFKNTNAAIELTGEKIKISADTEERCKAAFEVLKDKWVRRELSLKQLDTSDPLLSGKTYSQNAVIKEGISSENAKKVTKLIRDQGPKSAKSQIQGDELRVSSKSKDDLQAVMALVKSADFDFAVQFTNFR
ncbi:MAG: hypothetical protein RL587_199 [Actinomycetota bacterium]|jgi:hypothetical protein